MSSKQHPKLPANDHFYPYLSIDPKIKPQHHPEIPISQSLDYLNIKFDTKRELRETYIQNFKNKLAAKLFRESTDSLDDAVEQKHSLSVKKKTLNPEQLIRSSGHNNIKEAIFMHQHRLSSNRHKPITSEEKKQSEDIKLPKSKCFTFHQLSTADEQKLVKPKKQIFQKMLRKVDQLREIYKYETELMSITEVNDHVPLRFHTEPISVELTSKQSTEVKNIKNKLPKAYFIPQKQSPQHQERQHLPSGELISAENKTLEVRKYRNETSVKRRMQFLLKRQLMKQEFSFLDQKPFKSKTEPHPPKSKDKDAVGPWDIEQSHYFLKEY